MPPNISSATLLKYLYRGVDLLRTIGTYKFDVHFLRPTHLDAVQFDKAETPWGVGDFILD